MSPLWSSSTGAQVVLDGQVPLVVDLQDHGVAAGVGLGQATIASQAVWSATELVDSEHIVVISMSPGVQNVVLDGLIVTSAETLHDNAVVDPAPGASSSSSSTRPTTIATAKFSTSISSSFSVSTSSFSFTRSKTASSSQHTSSDLFSSSTRLRTFSRAAQTTNLARQEYRQCAERLCTSNQSRLATNLLAFAYCFPHRSTHGPPDSQRRQLPQSLSLDCRSKQHCTFACTASGCSFAERQTLHRY
ncbi:hypothetical protein C8R47DRAFT_172489 [Mycena vitilis]|nr:hypothetical protein C8R47DRAFT_172489 [Mycena vitilis]